MTERFYTDLYEKLYAERGYHADLDYDEHSAQATGFVIERYGDNAGNLRVLDVGCSNGKAVERLTTMGFNAHGIDVSPTAVGMCRARGLSTCSVGSATAIPHEDSSFDMIVSTDVLEHLRPEDLQKMVGEFSRVVRDSVVLKIAVVPEYQKFSDEALHLTVMPALDWLKLLHPKFALVEVLENCPDFFTVHLKKRDSDESWDEVFPGYRAALHEKEAINLQGRVRRSRRALAREKERGAQMQQTIDASKEEISRLSAMISNLEANLKKNEKSLAAQKNTSGRLKATLEQEREKQQQLKNSKAYKLGRFILLPFRQIGRIGKAFSSGRR
ncbi:MAG: methyltransferase domain-containing protein [Verrucomicrobiaceae bacterium]|nr:MAG: methyltransferase domain-containing protein [Verrucomicrobiaceae bacterium]